MALLGSAALAMWWDIAAPVRQEFEHWHSHEHFPERLSIPGFLRASRWASADGGEGFFVLYELAGHGVLASPGYLVRLNAPSPWSAKLMPHHRNMVRSQCHVLESAGGALARHALTVRLAQAPGDEAALQARARKLAAALVMQLGLAGVHVLRHEAPMIAATTEQKIRRNADGAAQWIFIVCGYDAAALESVAASEVPGLVGGAQAQTGLYTLSMSMTAQETAVIPPG